MVGPNGDADESLPFKMQTVIGHCPRMSPGNVIGTPQVPGPKIDSSGAVGSQGLDVNPVVVPDPERIELRDPKILCRDDELRANEERAIDDVLRGDDEREEELLRLLDERDDLLDELREIVRLQRSCPRSSARLREQLRMPPRWMPPLPMTIGS